MRGEWGGIQSVAQFFAHHNTGLGGVVFSAPPATPAKWVDFHSVIQFVAGANLALFAFPGLQRPALRSEEESQAECVNLATRKGRQDEAIALHTEFMEVKIGLTHEYDLARASCLVMAVLSTALLLWATYRAGGEAEPVLAWWTVAFGLAPGIWLWALNYRAARKLRKIAADREALSATLHRTPDAEAAR